MSEELILQLGRETLKTTALLAAPMLGGALIIGLVVSVIQAVTQINEATLTFIPKMIIVGLIFMLAAPWMLDVLNQFTVSLFENMADMVRIR
jgi:flagellar biosynthesis protein FliQ